MNNIKHKKDIPKRSILERKQGGMGGEIAGTESV